jgi:hypothetical protein
MTEPTQDTAHIEAHKHSTQHRHTLMASIACGCFSCYAQFTPADITEWCDEYETTAKCPKCKTTAVIGDASGYPVHRSFLERMHIHWHPHKSQ